MNTKLTLSVDKEIIEQAKIYAKKSGRSLSELIENYLKALISRQKETFHITPKVKKLKGSISLPKEGDEKDAYGDYLSKKHS